MPSNVKNDHRIYVGENFSTKSLTGGQISVYKKRPMLLSKTEKKTESENG